MANATRRASLRSSSSRCWPGARRCRRSTAGSLRAPSPTRPPPVWDGPPPPRSPRIRAAPASTRWSRPSMRSPRAWCSHGSGAIARHPVLHLERRPDRLPAVRGGVAAARARRARAHPARRREHGRARREASRRSTRTRTSRCASTTRCCIARPRARELRDRLHARQPPHAQQVVHRRQPGDDRRRAQHRQRILRGRRGCRIRRPRRAGRRSGRAARSRRSSTCTGTALRRIRRR